MKQGCWPRLMVCLCLLLCCLSSSFAKKLTYFQPEQRIVVTESVRNPFLSHVTAPVTGAMQFQQAIDLHQIAVPVTIQIPLSSFMRSVVLQAFTLGGDLQIGWSEFNQDVDISYSQFRGSINLNGSSFLTALYVNHVRFYQPVTASQVVFAKKVSWSNVLFERRLDLSLAQFKQLLQIEGSEFGKNINLSYAEFDGPVIFLANHVQGNVNLSHAHFKGRVQIRNLTVGGVLNLSAAWLDHADVYIQQLNSNRSDARVLVNLLGVDLKHVHLNLDNVDLFFPSSTLFKDKVKLYSQLIGRLNKNKSSAAYQRFFAEKQQLQLLAKKQSVQNMIFKHFWNYGLDKSLAYQWLGLLFLLYVIINTLFYQQLVSRYFSVGFLSDCKRASIAKMNVVIRCIYFFPYAVLLTFYIFTSAFVNIRFIAGEMKASNILVTLYLFLIMITGYVSLFFLLAFIINRG